MADGKAVDPDEQLREWAESVGIWGNFTGKPTKLDSVISPDLESCRKCRHRVSRLAKICPKCGCTNPYLSFSGNAVVTGFLIPALLLFGMSVLVISEISKSSEKKPESRSSDCRWTQATASHNETVFSRHSVSHDDAPRTMMGIRRIAIRSIVRMHKNTC